MTAWTEFNEQNIASVPEGILGVFQLSRGGDGAIAYVGRSDTDLKRALRHFLGKGYTHFQWTHVPWSKEGFEMSCRLFHYAGGKNRLDNPDHPYPPEGKFWKCTVSSHTPSMCEL